MYRYVNIYIYIYMYIYVYVYAYLDVNAYIPVSMAGLERRLFAAGRINVSRFFFCTRIVVLKPEIFVLVPELFRWIVRWHDLEAVAYSRYLFLLFSSFPFLLCFRIAYVAHF